MIKWDLCRCVVKVSDGRHCSRNKFAQLQLHLISMLSMCITFYYTGSDLIKYALYIQCSSCNATRTLFFHSKPPILFLSRNMWLNYASGRRFCSSSRMDWVYSVSRERKWRRQLCKYDWFYRRNRQTALTVLIVSGCGDSWRHSRKTGARMQQRSGAETHVLCCSFCSKGTQVNRNTSHVKIRNCHKILYRGWV